jgi:glucan biosynthesis protein
MRNLRECFQVNFWHRGMKFGTNHEIDSLATLTGKVFPFLYNDLQYFDERCVKVSSHNQTECKVYKM